MKKVVFLIATLFLYFGSYAQSYIPFPETDVKWIMNIHKEGQHSKGDGYCYDSHIETAGDTVMGGLKYIMLEETRVYHVIYASACFTYVDTITSSFYGWMRNDTINKKVYFRKWNWNKDTLLYDFNMGIGDTLNDTYLLNNYTQLNLYTIDTIKNYIIGGVNRKVYFIDEGDYILTDSVIEGVGYSKGIFTQYKNYKIDYTFLCMNISGVKIYPQDSSSCPLITSVDEKKVSNPKISIYPNPASETVNIELSSIIKGEAFTFELVDLQGKVVVQKGIKNAKSQLNISSLANGTYVYRLMLSGEKVAEGKLIKQ